MEAISGYIPESVVKQDLYRQRSNVAKISRRKFQELQQAACSLNHAPREL
jgi:hypothetical protein